MLTYVYIQKTIIQLLSSCYKSNVLMQYFLMYVYILFLYSFIIFQRSDKQREAALAKGTVEELEDDMDIPIEPVVDEPREKRQPKGRGKRKSQRRQ